MGMNYTYIEGVRLPFGLSTRDHEMTYDETLMEEGMTVFLTGISDTLGHATDDTEYAAEFAQPFNPVKAARRSLAYMAEVSKDMERWSNSGEQPVFHTTPFLALVLGLWAGGQYEPALTVADSMQHKLEGDAANEFRGLKPLLMARTPFSVMQKVAVDTQAQEQAEDLMEELEEFLSDNEVE